MLKIVGGYLYVDGSFCVIDTSILTSSNSGRLVCCICWNWRSFIESTFVLFKALESRLEIFQIPSRMSIGLQFSVVKHETYRSVTKTFRSSDSNSHVEPRFAQVLQGLVPEHLIFCFLQRLQAFVTLSTGLFLFKSSVLLRCIMDKLSRDDEGSRSVSAQ